MTEEKILVFRPYPFAIGQRLHIDGGPRGGDWEVVAVSAGKMLLRCPVSGRKFEWDRFCYFVEESAGLPWPQQQE